MSDLWGSVSGVLTERAILRNVVVSLVLIVVILIVRRSAMVYLRRSPLAREVGPLRMVVQVRWISLSLVVLGLVIIWAHELRTLAFSLIAIAAAVVLATKELIMCLAGTLVRASSQSFEIGHRIEIDGIRGEVIDHRPLTTTLLEIGAGHERTGRTVVFPNSVFLSMKVFNETLDDEYVLHAITIPVALADAISTRDHVLGIAREVCAEYLEDARTQLDASAVKYGLRPFSVEPRVGVQVTEPDKVTLLLRVPVKARERGRLEQLIVGRFVRDRETRV